MNGGLNVGVALVPFIPIAALAVSAILAERRSRRLNRETVQSFGKAIKYRRLLRVRWNVDYGVAMKITADRVFVYVYAKVTEGSEQVTFDTLTVTIELANGWTGAGNILNVHGLSLTEEDGARRIAESEFRLFPDDKYGYVKVEIESAEGEHIWHGDFVADRNIEQMGEYMTGVVWS